VFLRLERTTSGEAPSRSFGDGSPNDSEGASVAFTADILRTIDHVSHLHVPSRGAAEEGDESAFLSARVQMPQAKFGVKTQENPPPPPPKGALSGKPHAAA